MDSGGENDAGMARVEQAMATVHRAGFLPAKQRRHADADLPLPIGHGQTNSQPTTVRDMLVSLDVPAGAHVLDVGCGSGWTTALLAHLVGDQGSVVGVELEPELAQWGAANVAAAGRPWARVERALPGTLGWPEDAPYDRILVSAEARELPQQLVDQLGVPAVLVMPVAGVMTRVETVPDSQPRVERFGRYRFVPLR